MAALYHTPQEMAIARHVVGLSEFAPPDDDSGEPTGAGILVRHLNQVSSLSDRDVLSALDTLSMVLDDDQGQPCVRWPSLGVQFMWATGPTGGSLAARPLLCCEVRYLCADCRFPVICLDPRTIGDVIRAVVVHERMQHGVEVLDPQMWEAE